MPDELLDWERVGALLHEKAAYIRESSTRKGVTVGPLLNHFDSIVHRFRALAVHASEGSALPESESIEEGRSLKVKKRVSSKGISQSKRVATKTSKKPKLQKPKRCKDK